MTAHFDHYAPEPPCDKCALFETCRTQRLLCMAYEAYARGHAWEHIVRQPTSELFTKMFHAHTPEEYEKLELDLAKRRARAAARAADERLKYGRQSLEIG